VVAPRKMATFGSKILRICSRPGKRMTMATHLPSIRFNELLTCGRPDTGVGATSAAAPNDADGSERYSRCAKSWCKSGLRRGSQNQVSKPVGMPLESCPNQARTLCRDPQSCRFA